MISVQSHIESQTSSTYLVLAHLASNIAWLHNPLWLVIKRSEKFGVFFRLGHPRSSISVGARLGIGSSSGLAFCCCLILSKSRKEIFKLGVRRIMPPEKILQCTLDLFKTLIIESKCPRSREDVFRCNGRICLRGLPYHELQQRHELSLQMHQHRYRVRARRPRLP